MISSFFWDVTRRKLVAIYRRFETTYRFPSRRVKQSKTLTRPVTLSTTVAAAGSPRLLHSNAVTSNRLYLRSNSFYISWYGRKTSSSARLIRPHCLIVNLFLPPNTCKGIRVVRLDLRRDVLHCLFRRRPCQI